MTVILPLATSERGIFITFLFTPTNFPCARLMKTHYLSQTKIQYRGRCKENKQMPFNFSTFKFNYLLFHLFTTWFGNKFPNFAKATNCTTCSDFTTSNCGRYKTVILLKPVFLWTFKFVLCTLFGFSCYLY